MRSAHFSGREHNDIGAIDVIAEGPCAIAISRGGAPKKYTHTEPNEDACGFAWGAGGALLVVADGHHGAMGSELAVRHLMEERAERWTGTPAIEPDMLTEQARRAIAEINRAIIAEAVRCRLPPSPTTVSFAVVRPDDALLLHVSVGDSHVFWTKDAAAPIDLGWAANHDSSPAFVGRDPDFDLDDRCTVACEPLEGSRALVLATDGFSENGIGHAHPLDALAEVQARTLARESELRALETCRGVVESAMSVQRRNRSGDNIGCAVWTAD